MIPIFLAAFAGAAAGAWAVGPGRGRIEAAIGRARESLKEGFEQLRPGTNGRHDGGDRESCPCGGGCGNDR